MAVVSRTAGETSMHKKVTRRAFCSMLLAFPVPTLAQERAKIPRIGYLSSTGGLMYYGADQADSYRRVAWTES